MFATRRAKLKPCLECVSDWEYVIQHLVTEEKFSSHSARLTSSQSISSSGGVERAT